MALVTSEITILEVTSEVALVGSLAGTAFALRAYRLGFSLEPWAIIGRWTVIAGLFGLVIGLLLELK